MNMKKILLLTSFAYLLLNLETSAQSVAINNDGSLPALGAMLDIKSSTMGILIPRVSISGANDVTTVPDRQVSLLIYNTATFGGSNPVSPGYYYWNGSLWIRLTTNDNSLFSGWLLGGNSGTVDGTNYIGTNDNVPFNIRVNNQKAGRIENTRGNSFWGYQAGNSNTNGQNNTSTGLQALFLNTQGNYNTANGYKALYTNTTGSYNAADGAYALHFNTGDLNTAIGAFALYFNTTGYDNTAIGNQALTHNTTANKNTAIGFEALYSNNTGENNFAGGTDALFWNTTGSNNTASGESSLYNNSTGVQNTAHGAFSLNNNSTGFQNVAIGANSMLSNITGSYNTAVGFNTGPNDINYFNTTCIGIDATATGNDMVRIGNIYVGSIGGNVSWTTLSDGRYKQSIKEDVQGLAFIKKLRPVTYTINIEELDNYYYKNKPVNNDEKVTEEAMKIKTASIQQAGSRRSGFIAQEVEKAAKETGFNFSGVDAPANDKGLYGIRYADFVVPMVKAMQEQQQTIENLQTELNNLQAEFKALKEMVQVLASKK